MNSKELLEKVEAAELTLNERYKGLPRVDFVLLDNLCAAVRAYVAEESKVLGVVDATGSTRLFENDDQKFWDAAYLTCVHACLTHPELMDSGSAAGYMEQAAGYANNALAARQGRKRG